MPEDLIPEFTFAGLTFGDDFQEGVYALGILALFIILNAVVDLLLYMVAKVLTRHWQNQLGQRLIGTITAPVHLIVFVQGIFVSTTVVSVLDPWSDQIVTAWGIFMIVLVAMVIARSVNEIIDWYTTYASSLREETFATRIIPVLERVITVVIYATAGLLILDQLNIEISPLIAGLGIGGIAVALALQPTLSNFFAGTYLASSDIMGPGDYVEIEGGLRGYVTEISWRSTRIRTPFNNMVTIPNTRISDSILTNYYGPTMKIGVIVSSGVSYDSDLAHVERVALEVAREVVADVPGSIKDFQPWFGYEQFGDSNIDFWVWLEAEDRVASFVLKSELIKRLHKRFGEEGIEINYPVRKLVYADSNDGPPIAETHELRQTRTRSTETDLEAEPGEGAP